nr:MAG TPA: hypothetical protein [Caudoviricetes sp.]
MTSSKSCTIICSERNYNRGNTIFSGRILYYKLKINNLNIIFICKIPPTHALTLSF